MKQHHIRAIAMLAIGLAGTSQPAAAGPVAPAGRWTLVTTGTAPTPPMGWASWNAFRTDITEQRILASAQAMIDDGLAAAGYRHVNIDDGWWQRRRQPDGRLQVRASVFPSAAVGGAAGTSLRPFTDRIHAMGLKAGIYSDIGRNACSQAYADGAPNLPEGSVAEREVGLYDHVRQDIALFFGDWNFDYVKVDGCGLSAYGTQRRQVSSGHYRAFAPLVVDASFNQTNIPATRALYEQVRDALRAVRPNGDFVYSLCLWGRPMSAPGARTWARCGAPATTSTRPGAACSTISTAWRPANSMRGPAAGTIPTCWKWATASSTRTISSKPRRI